MVSEPAAGAVGLEDVIAAAGIELAVGAVSGSTARIKPDDAAAGAASIGRDFRGEGAVSPAVAPKISELLDSRIFVSYIHSAE